MNRRKAKYRSNKKQQVCHQTSLKGENSSASTSHDPSIYFTESNASNEGTRGTASTSVTPNSTKMALKEKDSPSNQSQRPSQFCAQPFLPHKPVYLHGDRYYRAWESLSENYHPKQREYDNAISAQTYETNFKKPKRKNIFQIGRRDNSISSSHKRLNGCGSSGSSSVNAPVTNNYRSLLLSSSYANIRKEPRPSSVHGHLGGSGHHHGVGKIRRNTDSGAQSSGTESGGSSGSSTREFGGGGHGRLDSEEVIKLI